MSSTATLTREELLRRTGVVPVDLEEWLRLGLVDDVGLVLLGPG